MTQRQLEDVQNIVILLGNMAEKANRLRENANHAVGRARRADLRCDLMIIEQCLQVAADALRNIAGQQERRDDI